MQAKLHRDRMLLEVQVFKEWRAVLGKQAATFLPEIYGFDKEAMVFAMEFLRSCMLLEKVIRFMCIGLHPFPSRLPPAHVYQIPTRARIHVHTNTNTSCHHHDLSTAPCTLGAAGNGHRRGGHMH